MSARRGDSVFVRYGADIWVEVAADGEIVDVVVDSTGLTQPVEAVRTDLSPVAAEDRAAAIDAAQTGEWPSWDVGPSPVAGSATLVEFLGAMIVRPASSDSWPLQAP